MSDKKKKPKPDEIKLDQLEWEAAKEEQEKKKD